MYSCNLMCCTDFVMFCLVELRLACVAAVSFPFQADQQASEEAHPRWAKDWGEVGRWWARRGTGWPNPLPLLLIFRTTSQFRSLRVSFWKRLLRRLSWDVFCFLVAVLCFMWLSCVLLRFALFFVAFLLLLLLFCFVFCFAVLYFDVTFLFVLCYEPRLELCCCVECFFWIVLCCAANKITGWHVRNYSNNCEVRKACI